MPTSPVEIIAPENGNADMDDKDVQRLEDRAAASEERSQLRLERVTERIEGSLTRIADQNLTIRQDIQEQRADGRALRTEVAQALDGIRSDIKADFADSHTRERAHFNWIIGTVIAVGLAISGLPIGVGQIWGSGVQYGQSAERDTQELFRAMQNTLRQIEDRAKTGGQQPLPPRPADAAKP